jgi:integrase
MRLPVKPLCEQKRTRTDGTSNIYFQYCYDADHKTFLNTEIKIPPEYWDKKRLCIRENLPGEFGNHDKLNDEIDRQNKLICDLIKLAKRQGIAELGSYVKERFSPTLKLNQLAIEDFNLKSTYVPKIKKKKEGFFNQLDDYIKSKEKKVQPATLQVYSSMSNHFEAFEKYSKEKITFTSFNYQLYEDFVDFLTFTYEHPRKKKNPVYGLRVNTIGKTIKQFRIFIKDRVKRRIIPAIDLTDYKIPEEESDAIYLTNEEIGKIYHLDLSEHPELIPYRDLFVLGCLTGLRFSDFSALEPEDLQQDMLYKKQEKSVHWVVIPMRNEAKEIFTRQFREQIPIISNVKFNENIKIIAKMAGLSSLVKFSYRKANKMVEEKKPKCQWVTSHTARRSFCTNEFLKGTPVYLIMKISGHKREKDFYRYIRIDPREAAEKIKMLWMERDEMQVFKNPLKRAINLKTA